jgi:hypothetical protein
MSLPIPQPATIPFLGNVANIEKDLPMRSFILLAEQYGPIFRLNLPGPLYSAVSLSIYTSNYVTGRKVIVFNSYGLINEASDEKRFAKSLNGNTLNVRNAVHDGLFTYDFVHFLCIFLPHITSCSARIDETNWGIARKWTRPLYVRYVRTIVYRPYPYARVWNRIYPWDVR